MTQSTQQKFRHKWIVASEVVVTDEQANLANLRRHMVVEKARLSCIEVYCCKCRRAWDVAFAKPCEAGQTGPSHLKGGALDGKRIKRTSAGEVDDTAIDLTGDELDEDPGDADEGDDGLFIPRSA